jgi:hypothetical protein
LKHFAPLWLLFFLVGTVSAQAKEKETEPAGAAHEKAADAANPKAAPAVETRAGEYLPIETLGFPIVPQEEGFGKVETVKEAAAPCAEYRRFTVSQTPPNPWKVQLQAGIKGPILKGETYLLIFYARAVEKKEAGGSAHLIVRTPPSFPTLAKGDFSVGREWATVVIPFVAAEDGPDGKSAVAIHLGGAVQKIDIGGLRLMKCWPEFPKELSPAR